MDGILFCACSNSFNYHIFKDNPFATIDEIQNFGRQLLKNTWVIVMKTYTLSIKREKKEALIESLEEYNQIEIFRGEEDLVKPFQMKLSEGKNLYDILGFQDTSNFAISERFYNLLKENNITGWRSYDVDIKGVSEKYYGFQVIGRCGRLIEPEEPGFYTGYKFDIDSWDKTDFFCPQDTVRIFCSEKLYQLIKSNYISNAEIRDITEVRGYSVGRK